MTMANSSQKRSANGFRLTTSCIGAVLLWTLFFAHIAKAEDKTQLFQDAVKAMQNKKGCESIPYTDLQSDCLRKSEEVDKMCKQSGPSSCTDVDPKKIQKDLEDTKTKKDELKQQKNDLEKSRSSASDDAAKQEIDDKIKEIDDKLEALKQTQESLEKQVQDTTKAINDRMYVAKSCRDYRAAVYEIFDKAISTANSENDAQFASDAKDLSKWWGDKQSGHQEILNNIKNAVDGCEKVLYDIGHLGSF
jgi:chromosome segregation ATPase